MTHAVDRILNSSYFLTSAVRLSRSEKSAVWKWSISLLLFVLQRTALYGGDLFHYRYLYFREQRCMKVIYFITVTRTSEKSVVWKWSISLPLFVLQRTALYESDLFHYHYSYFREERCMEVIYFITVICTSVKSAGWKWSISLPLFVLQRRVLYGSDLFHYRYSYFREVASLAATWRASQGLRGVVQHAP